MAEPLTEREEKLIDGFVWLRNVAHQNYHEGHITTCDTVMCKYANQIIQQAKETHSGDKQG